MKTKECIQNMTEEQKKGFYLVKMLSLRFTKGTDRIDTCWGNKTPLGLFLSIQRVIEDKFDDLPDIGDIY